MIYQEIYGSDSIKLIDGSRESIIPNDPTNLSRQQFDDWLLIGGNELLPADIPPTPESSPEWVEFNNVLLVDATWNALSAQLPVQVLIGIVSASVAGNPASLQFALDTAKTVMASLGTPIPVEALAGWQLIADLHNIPVTF